MKKYLLLLTLSLAFGCGDTITNTYCTYEGGHGCHGGEGGTAGEGGEDGTGGEGGFGGEECRDD